MEKTMGNDHFQAIFNQLKPILQRHAAGLSVTKDSATDYALDTKSAGPNGKRCSSARCR